MKLSDEAIESIWNKADCSRGDEAYLRDDVFDLINDLKEAREETEQWRKRLNEILDTLLASLEQPIKDGEQNE